MNQLNESALSKASFTAYSNMAIHHHDHRQTPHLHSTECDRYLSGFDKNRQARFYFTKTQTPCRVYLSYNEKLISTSMEFTNEKEKLSQVNTVLNGRKLSPKTLKTQLKISPQFMEEAKNFVFIKETMSLIPQLPQLPPIHTNQPLTMAEMAVLPLHLPSLNLTQITNTKHNKQNQSHIHKQSKQSNKIQSSNSPTNSVSNYSDAN